jgi:hypothetical protein
MGGYEIDAGGGPPTHVIEHIPEAVRRLAMSPAAAAPLPEVPGHIAITIIPFGTTGWESSDLISAWASIPGLGNQLHRRSTKS